MKISTAGDKNLEGHNLFVKFIQLFSVPILNALPDAFLRRFMKKSSHDAEAVLENVGSARALEVMYGKHHKGLFLQGFFHDAADFFWHHFISQPKGVRNRLKIVENNLEKEILRLTSQKNEKKISEEGEILFTHFGITGPAVLNISGKVGDLLQKGETKIRIDLFPDLNQEDVLKEFENILKKYPRKTAKNILSEFVPEKLAEVLLDIAVLDKNMIVNNLPRTERVKIAKILKNIEVTPEDNTGFSAQGGPASGWDQAMVTRGGISLKEIDHKTMKSKIIDNLFFAGEIIDVDGKTGGFNLQMCWSTGYLAGKLFKI